MKHRHIQTTAQNPWHMDAVCSCIERGAWHDWKELARAAWSDRLLITQVIWICSHMEKDFYNGQWYKSWKQHAERHLTRMA